MNKLYFIFVYLVAGGGENPMLSLKPMMESVLAILARECVEGVVGAEEEAGFSSSQVTNKIIIIEKAC